MSKVSSVLKELASPLVIMGYGFALLAAPRVLIGLTPDQVLLFQIFAAAAISDSFIDILKMAFGGDNSRKLMQKVDALEASNTNMKNELAANTALLHQLIDTVNRIAPNTSSPQTNLADDADDLAANLTSPDQVVTSNHVQSHK